eukprot:1086837-Amphidinium_carterae.1
MHIQCHPDSTRDSPELGHVAKSASPVLIMMMNVMCGFGAVGPGFHTERSLKAPMSTRIRSARNQTAQPLVLPYPQHNLMEVPSVSKYWSYIRKIKDGLRWMVASDPLTQTSIRLTGQSQQMQ